MGWGLRTLILRAHRAVLANERAAPVNQLLLRLGAQGLGVLNYQNAGVSGEAHFLRLLLAGAGPAPVVFDVGANRGEYARAVMELAPDARLFSFEPHPRTFAGLSQLAGALGFTATNAACGAHRGTIELWDYRDADGSSHASIHREVIEELHRGDAISREVPVETVDGFAEAHGIDRLALLKIDVEGHELAVLEGAGRLLERHAVEAVHFEFNEMNVVSRSFLRDFEQRLPGYTLFRLLPRGLLPLAGRSVLERELFAYQNVVALLPHVASRLGRGPR